MQGACCNELWSQKKFHQTLKNIKTSNKPQTFFKFFQLVIINARTKRKVKHIKSILQHMCYKTINH